MPELTPMKSGDGRPVTENTRRVCVVMAAADIAALRHWGLGTRVTKFSVLCQFCTVFSPESKPFLHFLVMPPAAAP